MFCQLSISNTITIATLLAATVSAGVVPAIKHDPITKRSEATWDKNGNIKLTCKFPLIPLHLPPKLN